MPSQKHLGRPPFSVSAGQSDISRSAANAGADKTNRLDIMDGFGLEVEERRTAAYRKHYYLWLLDERHFNLFCIFCSTWMTIRGDAIPVHFHFHFHFPPTIFFKFCFSCTPPTGAINYKTEIKVAVVEHSKNF